MDALNYTIIGVIVGLVVWEAVSRSLTERHGRSQEREESDEALRGVSAWFARTLQRRYVLHCDSALGVELVFNGPQRATNVAQALNERIERFRRLTPFVTAATRGRIHLSARCRALLWRMRGPVVKSPACSRKEIAWCRRAGLRAGCSHSPT
jgi:hypothetical protein